MSRRAGSPCHSSSLPSPLRPGCRYGCSRHATRTRKAACPGKSGLDSAASLYRTRQPRSRADLATTRGNHTAGLSPPRRESPLARASQAVPGYCRGFPHASTAPIALVEAEYGTHGESGLAILGRQRGDAWLSHPERSMCVSESFEAIASSTPSWIRCSPARSRRRIPVNWRVRARGQRHRQHASRAGRTLFDANGRQCPRKA